MDRTLHTFNLLGSGDVATQIALVLVVLLALSAIGAVYVPVALQMVRLLRLDAALALICTQHKSAALRRRLGAAFQDSPVRAQFDEFRDRWTTVQDVSGGELSSVRLSEVLEREPLLPPGPRRSLLPHLPRLLLGATGLGTLVPYASHLSRGHDAPIELGLPVLIWGLGFALVALVASRWLEGTLEATASRLDRWAERAYPAAGPGELAAAFHRDQLQTIERLQTHISTFGRRAGGAGGGGVSVDVEGIAHDLSQSLSTVVEQHSRSLLQAHRKEVDHQRKAIESLEQVATSARRAADTLASSAQYLEPLLDELKGAGMCLERTARDAVTQAGAHSEQMDARLGDLQNGVERIGKRVELALTAPAGPTTPPRTEPAAKPVQPTTPAATAAASGTGATAKHEGDETAECEQVLRELQAEEEATPDAPKTTPGPAAAPPAPPATSPAPAASRATAAPEARTVAPPAAKASEAPAPKSEEAPGETPRPDDTDADIDRAVAACLSPLEETPSAPASSEDEAPPLSGGGGLSSLLTRR